MENGPWPKRAKALSKVLNRPRSARSTPSAMGGDNSGVVEVRHTTSVAASGREARTQRTRKRALCMGEP